MTLTEEVKDAVKVIASELKGSGCEILTKGDACDCGSCRKDREIRELRDKLKRIEEVPVWLSELIKDYMAAEERLRKGFEKIRNKVGS